MFLRAPLHNSAKASVHRKIPRHHACSLSLCFQPSTLSSLYSPCEHRTSVGNNILFRPHLVQYFLPIPCQHDGPQEIVPRLRPSILLPTMNTSPTISQKQPRATTPPSNRPPKAKSDGISDADSAYVSMAGTNHRSVPVRDDRKNVPARETGRPIADTKFLLFKRGGNEQVLKHYETIGPTVTDLLAREVTENGFDPPSMAVKLAILGESHEDACYRVVVLATPELETIVNAFFESPGISQLLNPARSGFPGLPYVFIPASPKLTSAPSEIEVFSREPLAPSVSTHCGSPIQLRTNDRHIRKSRNSTFGGVIKVSYFQDESKLYGFTAYHPIRELRGQCVPATPPMSPTRLSLRKENSWASLHDWQDDTLGTLIDSDVLLGVRAGKAKPTHDWSLFTVNHPLPNRAISHDTKQDGTKQADGWHDILVAENPDFHDGVSDPVILLGGVESARRGELSSLPARIWVQQSKGFINAYPLELSNGFGRNLASTVLNIRRTNEFPKSERRGFWRLGRAPYRSTAIRPRGSNGRFR